MERIGEWCRRIWYLLNRSRFDEALRRDMEAHRSLMNDPRRFGNTLRIHEEARDVWGWRWLDTLARDLRFAVRALRRTPGFTIVTVSSLALGFALTAATVAVVNAYLIRSVPYPAADRLYHVMYAPPGPWEPRGMSALDWSSLVDVVEFPITSLGDTFYLTDREFSQSARGLRASRGFVEGLGVRAVVGRSFNEFDFAAASDRVVLIGHALWRDRYGADPGVIGRMLRADREEGDGSVEIFRVVGVLPADFYFGRDSRDKVDLLVPLTSPARTYMVRLRAGVPRLFAERRITEAARTVASGLPSDWSGVHLESVRERYVAQLRPVLVGVTVAAGLVLVIVCANVAVLMLLCTVRRQKELAVRAALGSGRGHLARMLLVEAGFLCVAALAAALALTQVVLQLIAPLIETQLGRPAPGGTAAIAVDSTVLLIIGGAGLGIALSLSLFPLLTPWQHRLSEALRRDGTVGPDGRSMRRLRVALITFEVAGTLVLLVGCGLFVRSAVTMVRTDLGFEAERLVRSRVVLRGADYADAQAFAGFYDRFAERVSGATQSAVVFTSWPPFIERSKQSVEVDGRVGQQASAGAILVSAGYFGTFGIQLQAGRDFTAADAATGAEPVAVISETLARRLWPDGSAIGQRVRGVEPTPAGAKTGPWRVVVGIAADVRQAYADSEVGDLYLPRAAEDRFGSFYVRTDQPPGLLLGTLRAIAAELDPHAMIDAPRSVASENRELAGTTFLTAMLTGFAAIAGLLAILGIYGVTAYAVQQREREIAIRMALGAATGAVVRVFLKEGALVLAIGLGFGLIGAVVAGRVLENRLYAVRSVDPWTMASTCVLMAAAGVLATWWPARRASNRSPIVALKDV